MTASSDPARSPFNAGLGPLSGAAPLRRVPAVRWREGVASDVEEQVIEEVPVALVFNQVAHAVMMATPTDLHDFAIGFSLTEELIPAAGAITAFDEVRHAGGIELQMVVDPALADRISTRSRRMAGRSGCGICGADSVAEVLKSRHTVREGGSIRGAAIHAALEALASQQTLNAASGAVHAAGWATRDGALTVVREDVGRHNALDKVIGALLRTGIDPADGFLVVTSRASFEMVQKSAASGAPLLAAISGPTALAIRVAEASGLTLVGFARKGGHSVFAHAGRVVR